MEGLAKLPLLALLDLFEVLVLEQQLQLQHHFSLFVNNLELLDSRPFPHLVGPIVVDLSFQYLIKYLQINYFAFVCSDYFALFEPLLTSTLYKFNDALGIGNNVFGFCEEAD